MVGETGSGKSSIFQLIERFYDVDSGAILVDGQDVKNYDLSSLRRQIGYVGQEPVLFAMTIKENLLLAKPDASSQELEEALRVANAYEFVMALE